MTTAKLKIQLATFRPDETKDVGIVNKKNAIEKFQSFHWDEQITIFRKNKETSIAPSMIFRSDDKKEYVVITCFIDSPETIAETFKIKYETEERLMPFLPVW